MEIRKQLLLAEPDKQSQPPKAADLRGKEKPKALEAAEGNSG